MRPTGALAILSFAGTTVAVAQAPSIEGWAGGGLGAATRHAAVAGAVGSGTGSGLYLQAGLRYRFVTVRARFLSVDFIADSGTQAIGTITSREAYVSLGPPAVGADLGVGRRTFAGTLAERTWSYLTAGARADVPIGSSGFVASAVVHVMVSPKEVGGASRASGRVAETALRFRPRSTPLYLLLGYRVEQFTVKGTQENPDEVGTVIVGGGLHFQR